MLIRCLLLFTVQNCILKIYEDILIIDILITNIKWKMI